MDTCYCNGSSQRGVATLFTAVVLLLVSTLLVFAVARSTVSDQKKAGDELRLRELYSVAIAGLDYGMDALRTTTIVEPWTDTDSDTETTDAGSTTTPTTQPATVTLDSGNTYGTTVTIERLVDVDLAANIERPIFRMTSVAAPTAGDQHLSRTVSTLVLRSEVLGSGFGSGAPIVVEGDLDVQSSVEVVPGGDGVAIASLTSTGTVNIANGPELHGGVTTAVPAGEDTNPGLAIFGIDNSTTEGQAALNNLIETLVENDTTNTILKIDDPSYKLSNLPAAFTDSSWLGSNDVTNTTFQHIVYFSEAAGCPKINANVNIVGLIFVSTPNCDLNGWGGCNIYGTLALSGNGFQLNANCQFIGLDLAGKFDEINTNNAVLSAIPGTFKDY